MVLQAVKVEGKRKPEVPGVKSLSLSDSQRLLFALILFDLYPVRK